MNQLPILIKREFWEHRNTFVVLPLVTTAFFALMLLLVFMASSTEFVDMTIDIDHDEQHEAMRSHLETDDAVAYLLQRLDQMGEGAREDNLNKGLQAMGVPLVVLLWFVIFFYLLACLYDDRRDRSILFWKSMPVSDSLTVVSKLITALFVVPLIYLAGIAVLQLLGLVLLTFGAMGTEYAIWDTIWGPANLFGNWFRYIGIVLFYAFWALPFFGWLLAVSSFAKSVPLAWAAGLPIALSITERIFTGQSSLADWMGKHTVPVSFLNNAEGAVRNAGDLILSLQMLSAIIVGGALVVAAIWLRGRADEI